MNFYNHVGPHQAMNNRLPMAAWRAGMDRIETARIVDMPLRLDNANALPTYPQSLPPEHRLQIIVLMNQKRTVSVGKRKRGLKVAMAKKAASSKAGHIFIGIGGWTFPPWRSIFYPEKLPQHRELEYAASKLTSIEINGTYSQFPMSALAP